MSPYVILWLLIYCIFCPGAIVASLFLALVLFFSAILSILVKTVSIGLYLSVLLRVEAFHTRVRSYTWKLWFGICSVENVRHCAASAAQGNQSRWGRSSGRKLQNRHRQKNEVPRAADPHLWLISGGGDLALRIYKATLPAPREQR